jgi:flagellar protein FlaH
METNTTEDTAVSRRIIIPSGNGELDSKMGGGIPAGSLMLVEGESGAGKSVLTQQIIWGSLNEHLRVALFTSENTVRSLVKQMESLGLDILDFLLLGRMRIYPMELSRLGKLALPALLNAIRQELDHNLIVVDSLTVAIPHATPDEILACFEACKRFTAAGTTIITTLHDNTVSGDVLVRIRSMCDVLLQLNLVDDGRKLVKMLEVVKVRGADAVTGNVVSFDVEPGWGMRVVPVSKVKG